MTVMKKTESYLVVFALLVIKMYTLDIKKQLIDVKHEIVKINHILM